MTSGNPGYCNPPTRSLPAVYNEAAFRLFLNADRRRATRTGRSLVLLLVSFRTEPPEVRRPIPSETAAVVFRALTGSVRDVDFVGWLRDSYVIGAVLPQGSRVPDVPALVVERVRRVVQQQLPSRDRARLRVRMVRLGGHFPMTTPMSA